MKKDHLFELAENYISQTGISVFLTGRAGTGKTTFLKYIVENTPKRCVVLAPTGVAAINAGGVTIHSFFQLPLCPYLPDVEELVTDVFVTLWQNVEKVQPESLKGYLCCIAKTRAINRLKANKFGDVLNIEDIDPEDDFNISHATEKKEISQELMELVEKIQEPDKEILIRHYFYYQKIADIANAMAIKAETVKVKLHRTRNKLKEMLMERGYTL